MLATYKKKQRNPSILYYPIENELDLCLFIQKLAEYQEFPKTEATQ